MRNNFETDIAIIGMAGKFPGAENIEQFWSNIINKTESIILFDDEELSRSGVSPSILKNPNYIKAKGYLANASMFDAKFFGFSEREAEIHDPQLRLLLESAWDAMENAAYIPGDERFQVGVFVGASARNSYYINNILKNYDGNSHLEKLSNFAANSRDFLATLVAYKLNLTGPCVTVQTACSTSLVAIIQACENLLNNRCDIALAGGVSVTVPLKSGYFFEEGMILSKDGSCRPFDENANGTVVGNGVGVLVLKKFTAALADNDYIHAVIKGFAVNNDGGLKLVFFAPSVKGQQAVIQAALNQSGLQPGDIGYIEAHGTGTLRGDPVEIAALSKVFSLPGSKKIPLGSVKSNIGHLDVASGVAGCIKTIEALKHKTLPPTLHFDKLNPEIQSDIPFYINTQVSEWPIDSPFEKRTAGVSSFGIGGTNAHIIIQEAPDRIKRKPSNEVVLIVLSAKALSMLIRCRRNLANYLKNNPTSNLSDIAYTLQVGRKPFNSRYACICTTIQEAIEKLEQVPDRQGVGFGLQRQDNRDCGQLIQLARDWLDKKSVDWLAIYDGQKLHRQILPSYPYERKEYWVSSASDESEKTSDCFGVKSFESSEKKLLDIFKYYLGSDEISSFDSFYDFGGDSLLSMQVVAEINRQLNLNLAFTILKNYPTASDLSVYIKIT